MKNNSIISYYKGDISDSLKDNQDYCFKHLIYNKIVLQYLYSDGCIDPSIRKEEAEAIKIMLTSYDDFIKNADIRYHPGNTMSVEFKCYEITINKN